MKYNLRRRVAPLVGTWVAVCRTTVAGNGASYSAAGSL